MGPSPLSLPDIPYNLHVIKQQQNGCHKVQKSFQWTEAKQRQAALGKIVRLSCICFSREAEKDHIRVLPRTEQ